MSEREFNEIVAERIRYYLDKYEITQAELAKRLGVGSTSVYNWLRGIKSPRVDKIDAMCRMFHCERSDLLTDTATETPQTLKYTLAPAETAMLAKYRALGVSDKDVIEATMNAMLEKKTDGMEDNVDVG